MCPCQLERRVREDTERQNEDQDRQRYRLFGSLLTRIQTNLFGANLNRRARARNRNKEKRCSYSKLTQSEDTLPPPIYRPSHQEQVQEQMVTPMSEMSSTASDSSVAPRLARLPRPLVVSLREEDYDWGDEELTCNVCDRSFPTPWDLESHMIKRRHWGCTICETLFNSVMELEHHKEEQGHWSDEEEDSDSDDDVEDDTDYEDMNGNQAVSLVYEEETMFGAEIEERILLCNQY